MPGGDPHWGEPKRVRTSVLHAGRHVGYVTTVGYPDRDLTAFPEGTPYSEVVVADLSDRHVALLQRFRQHWLVHCGDQYTTTSAAGELKAEQIAKLAVFALVHAGEGGAVLAAVLKGEVERMLGG
jgi:hypothetical protein